MPEIEASPAKRNSIICPCCLQFVEGASILVDPINGTITNGDKSIRLRPQNFKLAKYLIDCFPMTATKEAIYDSVFADVHGDGPEVRIIDVIIHTLRSEFAEIGFAIETVWGRGYRLLEADPASGTIKADSLKVKKRTANRWTSEHDAQLRELMGRNLKVSQCAAIMKMPYAAVERHAKALKEQVSA